MSQNETSEIYDVENIEDTIKCDEGQEVLEKSISDVVPPTTLLEDKRRARTKSTGRPPSREFMKETILQNSSSIDTTHNETDDKQINNDSIQSDFQSLTKIVDEIKEQPKIHSIVTSSTSIERFSTNWKDITLKKTTAFTKQSNLGEKTPPWLKEFRERKSHRFSLETDELLNKPERERYTVVEVNVSATKKVETDNVNEPKIDKLKKTETVRLNENIVPTITKVEPKPSPSVQTHDISNNNFETVENRKNLEDAAKKVQDFIIHSKKFQSKMEKDLKTLEKSLNNAFEKQIQELEEVKKNVLECITKK